MPSLGILDSLKTWRLRTILATSIIISVAVRCLISVFPDDVRTLVNEQLDELIDWWYFYAYLLGLFYFLLSPFVKTINKMTSMPSYPNFSRWFVAWILVAALQHFPSFRSTEGEDLLKNYCLFEIIFFSSLLVLVGFRWIYVRLCNMGLVPPPESESAFSLAPLESESWNILQYSVVLSIACCGVYSHCGNHAILEQMLFEGKCYGWFFLWKKEERNRSIPKFLRMNEFKYEICSSWFAPVGSAYDDPLLSKWMSTEEGAGLYSLWATFVGLYMVNFVLENLALGPVLSLSVVPQIPKFLNMVQWYSGTVELFKTAFNLVVSQTLFLSRFDMRMMQAAMNKVGDGVEQDFFYDHFSEKDDFWFDFMADTGDGWNSSYSIARLLAQPILNAKTRIDSVRRLPRGNLLLIGGDLAYPNPSASTYKNRFFRPFKDALQPPTGYKSEQIPMKKPRIPSGFTELKQYDGPQAFIIPGNHDWLDGLHTFMRYICHKSWLGGWFMPQKMSYFALKLPKNWWVFGLDLALHHDIDADQFIFFSELAKDKVGDEDSVIILTHEPSWLLDWYENDDPRKNLSRLICVYLKERCKLRIAGDLHHYMRHSCEPSHRPVHVEHLLVNGCGGAFLHPTHVFGNFKEYSGATYKRKASYPSFQVSSRIAFQNLNIIRQQSFQVDLVGGFIYFVLAFSMFPLCNLDHMFQDVSVSSPSIIFIVVQATFEYLRDESYVSLASALLLLFVFVIFVPSKVSWKKRVVIGVLHALAHLTAALITMIMIELIAEVFAGNELSKLLGEREDLPTFKDILDLGIQWTSSLCPPPIKYVVRATFDVQAIAESRENICQWGMESLSRWSAARYYVLMFFFTYTLSSLVANLLFGTYLYICVNWLHLHYDEAFSSLGIADYKGFTRFHINREGDLEAYTLVVDKVPKKWNLDPDWDGEPKQPQQLSHNGKVPSKWRSADPSQDPVKTVRIVDCFVINRTRTTHPETPVSQPAHTEPEEQEEVVARPSIPEEAQAGESPQSHVIEEPIEPEIQQEPEVGPSVEPEQ